MGTDEDDLASLATPQRKWSAVLIALRNPVAPRAAGRPWAGRPLVTAGMMRYR